MFNRTLSPLLAGVTAVIASLLWCSGPVSGQQPASESPPAVLPDLQDLRPRTSVLLREGTFLVRAAGSMWRDPVTDWWHFGLESEASSSDDAHDFILLPCFVLNEMQRMVESMPGQRVRFELTGEVFVFGTRNYLLPTFAPRLVGFEMEPATPEDPGVSEAEATGDAGDGPPVTAEDIERRLERALGDLARSSGDDADPNAPRDRNADRRDRQDGEHLVAEQTIMMNRRGTITRHGSGAWVFTFDADASGLSDPPMVLLPCRLLERIERLAKRSSAPPRVLLSGRVFVFNDRNFLMPTVYRAVRDRTPLNLR